MARPRTFDEATVVAAARNTFWRRGFAATSITDLEEATGLGRTSLYKAFGDKESLYFRTLAEYQTNGRQLLRDALAVGSTAAEGIRTLFELALANLTDDVDRRGCFLVNAGTERACLSDRIVEFLADNRERFVQTLQEHIEAGQQRGELVAVDAHTLANSLFMVYSGLGSMSRTAASRDELRRALDFTLRGLAL